MTEREAGGKTPAGSGRPAQERVVVRDKRHGTTKGRSKAAPATESAPAAEAPATEALVAEDGQKTEATAAAVESEAPATAESAEPPPAEESAPEEMAVDAAEKVDAAEEPAEPETALSPLNAELESLRSELDERLKDLQRVTAEYANYRKRVDRDRMLVVEQATGAVLASLLPILDDLDRAREHGDLVGPFGSVAEHLTTTLGKFGLTPFGEKGDPFDPTRHEAVAHQTSADVEEPTCVAVMRRGYLLGDRLLRAALVAVADPE